LILGDKNKTKKISLSRFFFIKAPCLLYLYIDLSHSTN